ncbi:MAG: hypothetical protein ACP5RW_10260, partial [bacterium]
TRNIWKNFYVCERKILIWYNVSQRYSNKEGEFIWVMDIDIYDKVKELEREIWKINVLFNSGIIRSK